MVDHFEEGVGAERVVLQLVEEGEYVEEVVLHGLGEVNGVVPVVALEQPDEGLALLFQPFPELLEVLPLPVNQGAPEVLVEERLVVQVLQAHLFLRVYLGELSVEDDGVVVGGAVGDLEEWPIAGSWVCEPELDGQHGAVTALADGELVESVPAVVGQLGQLHPAVEVE